MVSQVFVFLVTLVASTTTLRVPRSLAPVPPLTADIAPPVNPIAADVSVKGKVTPRRAARLPPPEKRVGRPRQPRRPTAPSTPAPALLDLGANTNTTALNEEASRLLQLHRPKQAAEVLTTLTRLTPEDGKVWIKLMSVHKRARRFGNAEAVVRDGIAACPQNGRLRQALADLCRERKQYAEARKHFKAAMEVEPELASVYDSWGRMEASLGENAAAASLYERGLELQQTARLCHALGVLLDKEGHAERARQVLRRGLKLPNEAGNPQLLHAFGMVEVRAANHGAARSLFLGAIKESPSFTQAYLSLGQLEERLGNRAAARRYYEEGATQKQKYGQLGAVQLWQAWARMEQRLGHDTAALSLYKRAHALFPDDEQLLVEWAKLAGERGDGKTARELFARIIEAPRLRSPYAYQCAANFEARRCPDDPEAARALYERGAALPATSGAAREERMPLLHAWAVFEWRQGERRRARELFGQAEGALSDGETCGWLYQWHANFEADGGNPLLARHYVRRPPTQIPCPRDYLRPADRVSSALALHAMRSLCLSPRFGSMHVLSTPSRSTRRHGGCGPNSRSRWATPSAPRCSAGTRR